MRKGRKLDLDHRLDAYFATLRSPSLREALKRRVGNWQIYAAVSGSALAMATGASASIIGRGIRVTPEPIASVRLAQQVAGSKGPPFLNDVWLAVSRPNAEGRVFNGARPTIEGISQTSAPSITPRGVVPNFGVTNIIQPGEWVSI